MYIYIYIWHIHKRYIHTANLGDHILPTAHPLYVRTLPNIPWMTEWPPLVSLTHIQASVHEADQSGKYDPLPVKVPVEAVKTWHDAEARGKGLGKLLFFLLVL